MKMKSFSEKVNQGSTSVWIALAAVVVVWGLVALMLIAGIFLYLERSSLAQQPPSNVAVPAISVQPTTATASGPLAISGQGWTPGSLISIYLLAPGQTQVPNFADAQATADAQGEFTVNVAIPSGSDWQTPGTAVVVARLVGGGASAQATFNLLAAPQTPTQTPTPTETPTLVPIPTSTLTPTATSGPTTPTATSKVNLNVRGGPGTGYPMEGVLLAGQSAEITGASADGAWWQILFPSAPDGVGWVSAAFVTSQDTQNVPVVVAPPLPQPTPASLAAAQPPTAIISGPSQVGQNQSIIFDGNGSTASAGHSIKDYAWNFGDGTTANGSTVSHSYGSSGNFVVSLTVTDDLGQTGTATLITQIIAQGPTAQFDAPKEGIIGQSINFDGSDSHAASGHSIVDYDWSFDDGHSGSRSQPDHTFDHTGTFDVRLRVTDDQGLTSEVRHRIRIEGLPTATPTPTATHVPATAIPTPTSTPVPPTATPTSTATPVPATATPKPTATPMPHKPPTAVISGPSTGRVGKSFSFSGGGSSAGSGKITEYVWSFGDEHSGSGKNTSHKYSKAGTYTVTLTVTNSDKLTDTTTLSVTIS